MWGDVPVHQVQRRTRRGRRAVGVGEAERDLVDDAQADLDGDALTAFCGGIHQLLEGRADDQLHRDVERIVGAAAEVEGGDDVRALDARGDGCLIHEHGAEALVTGEVGQHELEGDGLLERSFAAHARRVHGRHSPTCDGEQHFITPNEVSSFEDLLPWSGGRSRRRWHAREIVRPHGGLSFRYRIMEL